MREELVYRWQERQNADNISNAWFPPLPGRHRGESPLPLIIRHEIYEQGADTGWHLHKDFYALYIVRGGRGVHMINDHPYGIARGDVYLMPPGAIHAYRDYCALAIDACYFQPQLFQQEELAALRGLAGFWRLLITFEERSLESLESEEAQVSRRPEHRFHLSPERQRDIEEMVEELYAEFIGEQPESPLLVRALLFRLLVRLARWQGEQAWEREQDLSFKEQLTVEKGKKTLYKAGITSVLRICEEHFHEPLNVPQLATLMFLSPSRFSEVFQREVGVSPAAYIRRLRLERAQTLLRTTTLTSTEIAHQVGFRDSAQLSRAFRDMFHLTPSSYRATFRQPDRRGKGDQEAKPD